MSLNYGEIVTWGPVRATTPADNLVLMVIPANPSYDWLALSLSATVETAATTSATLILETNLASPVILATVTLGTSAARTTIKTLVAESLRQIAATTSLRVREDAGGDASAIYSFSVATTKNW